MPMDSEVSGSTRLNGALSIPSLSQLCWPLGWCQSQVGSPLMLPDSHYSQLLLRQTVIPTSWYSQPCVIPSP